MRILLIASYYKPDGGPAAPLFTMLCEELVRRGHRVTVLTAVPHYPSGLVPDSFHTSGIKETLENGVRVLRVGLPSVDRSRLSKRLYQFLAYQWNALRLGPKNDFDVVMTHTPAMEIWLPFLRYVVWGRKPFLYSIHDVYPEVGIRLGIFRNALVIKAVDALENHCLRHARRVRVLSQSFIQGLLDKHIPKEKIDLVYDWVEVDAIKPMPRLNAFSDEYGLSDKFVLLYAGNIGLVQALDKIIDAANLLRNEPDILFAFVGDGAGKAMLVEKVQQLGLTNVKFIPYQPRQRMPEIFAATDVSLVSLKKGTAFGALPSKTFSILSSGRPILACIDEGSDAWNLIMRANAGVCVPPEQPELVAQAMRDLKANREQCAILGQNGRAYVTQFHSPEYAAETFEKIFERIVL